MKKRTIRRSIKVITATAVVFLLAAAATTQVTVQAERILLQGEKLNGVQAEKCALQVEKLKASLSRLQGQEFVLAKGGMELRAAELILARPEFSSFPAEDNPQDEAGKAYQKSYNLVRLHSLLEESSVKNHIAKSAIDMALYILY